MVSFVLYILIPFQFAPGGNVGCLKGFSFHITGTLDPWTRSQADALIEEYGGVSSKTLKPDVDYAVIGTKPGAKKLAELQDEKFKDVQQIDQGELYHLIRTLPGDGSGMRVSREFVTDVCKRAKLPPKKKGKKAAA